MRDSSFLYNKGKPIEWQKSTSFGTAFMDALSMSFPAGEKFFIDSVEAGYKALPENKKQKFLADVENFCREEENHSKAHIAYNNKIINKFNIVNHWKSRSLKRIEAMSKYNVRHHLASTAAVEHITTVMGCWLLLNKHILDTASPDFKTMWIWHVKEELLHRKVAIDLYRELGGSEKVRLWWMKTMYILTLTDIVRQTIHHIWKMGGFFKFMTWYNAYHFLFSKNGLFRWTYPLFKAYGQLNYHPSQDDDLVNLALK